ncbi:MAG: polyketide synthase dehydratase domain-containing protein, partial [Gammaproteobacteria bacterium]|nr:polyketide synthase dehydratase domain-containing protein [Gammaproteobacteria bacterium]
GARLISSATGKMIAVELRGEGNVLHYSATVKMAEHATLPPQAGAQPALEKWTQEKVYDGHVLFHGPSFQVIDSIKGISREGIVGMLSGVVSGTRIGKWPKEAWCSDAAALDGGLQLALLWSQKVLGGAVLPMAMGEYRSYRDGLINGVVKCVVHAKKILDGRTVCDITFSDASGQFAELIGVETVLRPGGAKTAHA